MSEVQSRASEIDAFGEVFVTFADDPPNGPRLRIAPSARRVTISVPLLALIDAGESPWAEIRGSWQGGDPYGYRGTLLCIKASDRTVTYQIGDYLPADRSYVAELQEEPHGTAISR